VPIVWLPIAAYLLLRSAQQFTKPLPPVSLDNFVSTLPTPSGLSEVTSRAWSLAFVCFGIGNLTWTLLEYGFHRFLFHVDRILPDHPAFLTLHFLMHGIHHYLPMDRLRLVMPPPLFFFLSFPMTRLAYLIFPVPIANAIIAGAFTFCEHTSFRYSLILILGRRFIRLHALRTAPHETPAIHEGDEEVSPRSSLQEL
jgi:4-hydroxysphinganine ceramide fatty acyl 2-hydroxylase